MHYEAVITPANGGLRQFDPRRDLQAFLSYLEETYLANMNAARSDLLRLHDLDPSTNCHGWVFAGGRFGVHHSQVEPILADHDYFEVSKPNDQDIAIYREDAEIVHSGLVRAAPESDLLIESKWGPFGVFLHKPHVHFGAITYYRTRRPRHTLEICEI